MLVATEDERSGRWYFLGLAADTEVRRRCSVRVADHLGSAPQSVLDAADAANAEYERYDETWVVFDTEGFQNPQQRHLQARHAIERARQKGYRTAVSNPCFEVWLILHFETYPGSLADGKAAASRLRTHLPTYDKGVDCYTPTRPHLDTARRNARRLQEDHHSDPNGHPCDCHPCSQVYRLMDSLFGPLSPERSGSGASKPPKTKRGKPRR